MTATPHNHRRNVVLRGTLASLSTTLLGALVVIGVLSLFAVWSMNRAWERGVAETDGLREAARRAAVAEVEFKIMVQEWKNLLLRGHDPKDFGRYREAFVAQGQQVEKVLEQLAVDLDRRSPGPKAAAAEALRANFRGLGAEYRKALEGAVMGRDRLPQEAALQVDRGVRGIDRTLEESLATLSRELGAQAAQRREALVEEMQSRYRTLRSTVLGALVLAAVPIGLGLFGAMRKLRD